MSEATPDIEHPAVERAEVDRPNVGLIVAILVVTLTVLAGIVVGVNELFTSAFEGEISAKVLEPQSTSLRSLRAEEQRRLSQYQWVNEREGVVRIPLDRAVELTLKDYRERRPREPQPGPAAASASAATPAPASASAPAVEAKP